jgi:prefoldin subunit 5
VGVFGKIASVVGAIVVLGLLGMTVPTTIQLTRLDVGLRSSLSSTSKLVNIESTIIQKNKSLQTLIQTAANMNQSLQLTDATTARLQMNIASINQLNADTLHINQSIGTGAKSGAANLGKIASSLQQLGSSMSSLQQSLSALDGIVHQDVSNMDQMKQATHNMNSKVPGV